MPGGEAEHANDPPGNPHATLNMLLCNTIRECKRIMTNEELSVLTCGGLGLPKRAGKPERKSRRGRRYLIRQRNKIGNEFLKSVRETWMAHAIRVGLLEDLYEDDDETLSLILTAEKFVDSLEAVRPVTLLTAPSEHPLTGEVVMSKFARIVDTFDSAATPYNSPLQGDVLIANEKTRQLSRARIIWDDRPLKKDGTPDLRFSYTDQVELTHKEPKSKSEPEPEPESEPEKSLPEDWNCNFSPEAIRYFAGLPTLEEENRLAELRNRAERAKMARERVLKEHRAKVVKENGCHRRLRNFWKTGFRTCEICTEIKATADELPESVRKALGNTKHHGRTKMRGYTWNPTAKLWIPTDEDSGEEPVERHIIEHHKGRRRKKPLVKRLAEDRSLGEIEITFDEDGLEIWTVEDMRKHNDSNALKYLVGTGAHERRLARIMGAAPSVSESLRESADTIEAESKKLEETTHMVASRSRKLGTNRATPKQTN